jgi:hypothetical protein
MSRGSYARWVFFGSLEAALTTTADVALQVALAWWTWKAVQGIINGGLSGAALQSTISSREISKGVSVSVKVPITSY